MYEFGLKTNAMETQNDQLTQENPQNMANINLGILGHIDSGKTSLAKAISTLHSTAAFDKSPQSKQRGITLDLGFSAFVVPCKNGENYQSNVPQLMKITDTAIFNILW